MSDEGFLRRWARRKAEVSQGIEPPPEPESAPAPAAVAVSAPAPAPALPSVSADDAQPALPTMDDVAALHKESDYSAFVARGVDQAVRRSALKKLFADPHFNVMDGLDIYIDDYTKPSPVSEAMLASLNHARSVFAHMLKDVEAVEAVEEAAAEPLPPAPPVEAQIQLQSEEPPEQETQ
jgi:hypothetical protein